MSPVAYDPNNATRPWYVHVDGFIMSDHRTREEARAANRTVRSHQTTSYDVTGVDSW